MYSIPGLCVCAYEPRCADALIKQIIATAVYTAGLMLGQMLRAPHEFAKRVSDVIWKMRALFLAN
jgi:hypothetical protein